MSLHWCITIVRGAFIDALKSLETVQARTEEALASYQLPGWSSLRVLEARFETLTEHQLYHLHQTISIFLKICFDNFDNTRLVYASSTLSHLASCSSLVQNMVSLLRIPL